jgi:hypothetical protein
VPVEDRAAWLGVVAWLDTEEVDDAKVLAVIVTRHEREPHALLEEGRGHCDQLRRLDRNRRPVQSGGPSVGARPVRRSPLRGR